MGESLIYSWPLFFTVAIYFTMLLFCNFAPLWQTYTRESDGSGRAAARERSERARGWSESHHGATQRDAAKQRLAQAHNRNNKNIIYISNNQITNN